MHDESPQLDPLVGAYYERVPEESRLEVGASGSRKLEHENSCCGMRLRCRRAFSTWETPRAPMRSGSQSAATKRNRRCVSQPRHPAMVGGKTSHRRGEPGLRRQSER